MKPNPARMRENIIL